MGGGSSAAAGGGNRRRSTYAASDTVVHVGKGKERHAEDLQFLNREEKAALLFEKLDANGDGNISFAEFLALTDHLSADDVVVLRQQFNRYDQDRSGTIDRQEWVSMTLAAYAEVGEAEFDHWCKIVLEGTTVRLHHRKSLKNVGVKVEKGYAEPADYSVTGVGSKAMVYFGLKHNPGGRHPQLRRGRTFFYKGSLHDELRHVDRLDALEAKMDDLQHAGRNHVPIQHRNTKKMDEFEARLKAVQHNSERAAEWERAHHPERLGAGKGRGEHQAASGASAAGRAEERSGAPHHADTATERQFQQHLGAHNVAQPHHHHHERKHGRSKHGHHGHSHHHGHERGRSKHGHHHEHSHHRHGHGREHPRQEDKHSQHGHHEHGGAHGPGKHRPHPHHGHRHGKHADKRAPSQDA